MATEKLVVELDARTKNLDSALKKTNKQLDKVADKTKKSDSQFVKFDKSVKTIDIGFVSLAAAGLALATALTAVVLSSAKSQQNLAILSRQAKLSTEEFEALAFATKQYGINAEQIADISKDLSDKLGEFGKAGTGAFQDFADVVGLTKEEAKSAAIEFENMSGDQIIGEMVRQMEAAGASTNEMTFALESMGNDLSRLLPLFSNNSKELNSLTGTYKKATDQLKLTNAEIEGLQGVATTFDILTESMSKAGTLISAQIAPLLDEFFNGVIDVVPEATNTIIDFINVFKKAEDIKSIASINRLIEDQKFLVQELRMEQNELGKGFLSSFDSDKSLALQKEILNLRIKEENDRITELIASREKLTKQEESAKSKREGGTIGGTFTGVTSTTGGTGDEIQAIADRFKSEIQLLEEKKARELEIIGDNKELELQIEQEFQDKLAEIRQTADDAYYQQGADLRGLFEKNQQDELKGAEAVNKGKVKSDQIYTQTALSAADALFNGNKALDAGLVVTKTAVGVMNQFTSGDPYTAFARAAAVGVAGTVQLANVLGASQGGGSVGISAASPTTVTADEQEDTSTLNVSDTDTTGESESKTIVAATADDIAIALNELMNGARVSGVIS